MKRKTMTASSVTPKFVSSCLAFDLTGWVDVALGEAEAVSAAALPAPTAEV